ncbi:MAG: AarF/UbiB family protein [Actinomycetia bacterium]|nr:AarF/UbiB family protein [Actinomycetes bacterium]
MVFVSIGVVLLAALLLRRLLNVQRGRWQRAVVAVVVGEAATLAVLNLLTHRVADLSWRWYPLGIALVMGFSLLAMVLIELLFPARQAPRPWRVPHPFRSTRRMFGRITRYLRVAVIAARNGLLKSGDDDDSIAGSRLGRSLAATLEEAGGLFVKLGQAMAAQPQLVTAAVAAELGRLNDQAAPADPVASRAVIEAEIGAPETVFASFDAEPIAAASIGQTYFATLHDGRAVVVKVQRPEVAESVERDLDILERLAATLHRRTTWARGIGLTELVAGFAEATREELDYRVEAANCVAARAALTEQDPIMVPGVIERYTTRRVLVQERVPGRGIAAPGVLDGLGAEARTALADGLLALLMRQMLGGERFHADPHPGNVFLRPDGRLALIDFGSVGRLSRFERSGLIDIFRGIQAEDPALLRQAAAYLGTSRTRIDPDAFDRDLARLLARGARAGGGVDPGVFANLLTVYRDYGVALPRSTTTLFRALVTLLGTLEAIAPGYQLADAVLRLGGEVIGPILRPGSPRELVAQQLATNGPILSRLPRDIDDVVRALQRGELRTRVSLFAEPEDRQFAQIVLDRVVSTAIGAALAVASAILLTAAPRAGGSGGVDLLTIIGGTGLAASTLLLLRTLLQTLHGK